MISAKFVVAAVFALVASSFAAELDLKTLKGVEKNDVGLYHHVLAHGLHLSWFKPLVGKEITKVHCGEHVLWETTAKEHELNELLVLVKCASKEEGGFQGGFVVLSELVERGGLAHHYFELSKDGKKVEKEHKGEGEDFTNFLTLVLETLHKLNATKALEKPYPAVPAHYFFRHLRLAGEKAKAQAAHNASDAPASG